MNLNGKLAVVTGASRGIGKAIAEALSNDGAEVVNVSFHGGMGIDLSKRIERRGLINLIIRNYGHIDILVNNAGAQSYSPFSEYSLEDWDKSLSLMLTAPFELSQQASKHMVKQGHGKIINIASVTGMQGTRGIVGYSVAKAGLIHLTKCMSNELAPFNIQVNCIAPGFIETDMLKGAFRDDEHKKKIQGLVPARKFGKPDGVAKAVLALINNDYITGVCLPVDGGWIGR